MGFPQEMPSAAPAPPRRRLGIGLTCCGGGCFLVLLVFVATTLLTIHAAREIRVRAEAKGHAFLAQALGAHSDAAYVLLSYDARARQTRDAFAAETAAWRSQVGEVRSINDLPSRRRGALRSRTWQFEYRVVGSAGTRTARVTVLHSGRSVEIDDCTLEP